MADLVPSDVFDRLPERYQGRAREIAARVAELNRLLHRCEHAAILEAALRLQGQLRWQPETAVDEFGREFKLACRDLPEWAISEATNDFLSGRVANHTGQFMPTCAEFARHARSIILPFIGERAGLKNEAERLFDRAEDEARRQAIAIERMDPAVRQRVAALVHAATAGSAKISTDHRHTGIDPTAKAALDRYRKRSPAKPTRLLDTQIMKGARK